MNRNISVPLWQWHWEASTKKTAPHNLDQTWLGRKKYFCFSVWLPQVKGPWEYGAAFEKAKGQRSPCDNDTGRRVQRKPQLITQTCLKKSSSVFIFLLDWDMKRSFNILRWLWRGPIFRNWSKSEVTYVCIIDLVFVSIIMFVFAPTALFAPSQARWLPQDAVCGKSAS